MGNIILNVVKCLPFCSVRINPNINGRNLPEGEVNGESTTEGQERENIACIFEIFNNISGSKHL